MTNDKEETILIGNESKYIPNGRRHQIENIGRFDLELVEIKLGSILADEDITQYE